MVDVWKMYIAGVMCGELICGEMEEQIEGQIEGFFFCLFAADRRRHPPPNLLKV